MYKLQVGSVVEVHGFVMLSKLDEGMKYKVIRVSERLGKSVYHFAKARGTKEVVAHYANDVDMMINPLNNNHIEIVKGER